MMILPRKVSSETLDHLPEDNPDAIRSRRDLRRVHRFMRTQAILLDAFNRLPKPFGPLRILELGAGDATLMLGIARKLARHPGWANVHLMLLDRQNLVSPQTLQSYRDLGWQVETLVTDVLDWITTPHAANWDIILANLFIHHFEGKALSALITAIAARSNSFVACEPRRAWLPLIGSHLIGFIGVNAVTREDAVLSVHAGFRDEELSALWPQNGWIVTEYPAGLFSHCLVATRTS